MSAYKLQPWHVEFTTEEVRSALEGKSFAEIVDSVRRALDMALPICAHARPTGAENRKRAALIELEWRAERRA